ncbi:MAG: T9SS type A sorting domain-containing protein [Candidatus Kapabacteria bacterium]|nr:T9SS type A sorting domain-containing protein [Candidatus Kapabacteria bacterium]
MRTKLFTTVAIAAIWLTAAVLFFPAASKRAAALHEANVARLAGTQSSEREDESEEGEEFENPYDYLHQQEEMLRDPRTGKIPDDARAMELRFAERLPRAEGVIGKDGSRLQSQTWSPRGPMNVGGRVRALALDVENENIILAGAASGGMWRSTDGGTSWTRTTVLSDISSVTTVAQDRRPGKRNVWYYGTGEFRGSDVRGATKLFGDGIFKSTDGGKSWSRLASTVRNQPHLFASDFSFINKIVTDPTKTEDVVYAATYGGIYRSANGGETWTAVLGGNTADSQNRANWSDVVITSTGVLYAAISSSGIAATNPVFGIFRSTDGINWTNITMPDVPDRLGRINLGIAPSNENVMYVIAQTPGVGFRPASSKGEAGHSFWKYTYHSGDGSGLTGGSWFNRSDNLPGLQAVGGRTGNYDSQEGYDMYVRVKPDNENIVFLGGSEIYRSTNGFLTDLNTQKVAGYEFSGKSFALSPNQYVDQHELIFLPSNPNAAFTGNDGGVRRTDNIMAASEDIEWKILNNGFVSTQFYTIAIDFATPGDNTLLGGLQDQATYTTESNQATTAWDRVGSGDGSFCAIADKKSAIYYSTQNGTTNRVMGSRVARIDPIEGKDYMFINPFILDPNNNNVMYMAGGRDLWRNENLSAIPAALERGERYDRVQGWTAAAEAIPQGKISAFGASHGTNTRLFFGTSVGQVFVVENAQSGTMTPTEVTSVIFPQKGFITGIAVNPANADQAIVVFSNYSVSPLFYTSDGGKTWTAIGGNLRANPDGTGAGPSCTSAAFQNFGGVTRIFLGTSTGLYSTSRLDGANTTWAQEGASVIGNVPVTGVVARQVDGYVAIATFANGMYSTNVTAASSFQVAQQKMANAENITSAVVLGQNYPNPFAASTTIRYTLPEAASVRLRITNTSGREITTLVLQPQTAGEHTADWSGQMYGGALTQAGTYFYELAVTLSNGVTVRRTGQMMFNR